MGNDCKSVSHHMFKDKAKNYIDDLQGVLINPQSACQESRVGDVAVLEEQVNQMLHEGKAELIEASPTTSLLGDLSSEIRRLLQLDNEEDVAMSKLAELPLTNLKQEPVDTPEAFVGSGQGARSAAFQEELLQNEFLSDNQYRVSLTIDTTNIISNCQVTAAIAI